MTDSDANNSEKEDNYKHNYLTEEQRSPAKSHKKKKKKRKHRERYDNEAFDDMNTSKYSAADSLNMKPPLISEPNKTSNKVGPIGETMTFDIHRGTVGREKDGSVSKQFSAKIPSTLEVTCT